MLIRLILLNSYLLFLNVGIINGQLNTTLSQEEKYLSIVGIEINGIIRNRINRNLTPGNEIKKINYVQSETGYNYIKLTKSNGQSDYFPFRNNSEFYENIEFKPNSLIDIWLQKAIENNVYGEIAENGYQYDIRNELNLESIEYLNILSSNNTFFEDIYLENYLYSLLKQILPSSLNDGRVSELSIKVIKSNSPYASILPNGTILLSTGIISLAESEEELISVLLHEVSHFVLDHHIKNINELKRAKKRTEFWAAFATALAAGTEAYLSSQYDIYNTGELTYSTAVLAYSLALKATERMGLEYSREQEKEADICTGIMLEEMGIDKTAYSSILVKLKKYAVITGDYLTLTGEGTHPAIDERINDIGIPSKKFKNINYDKLISFAITTNAMIEYNNKHFKNCETLINRSIKSGVATEDDYILKAMVNLRLYDDPVKYKEALYYLNIAKELNVTPRLIVHKQEALTYLMIGNFGMAISSLNTYLNSLNSYLENHYDASNAEIKYYSNEIEWTKRMLHKSKNL
jgi:Zn-dependent protease with chaperone function